MQTVACSVVVGAGIGLAAAGGRNSSFPQFLLGIALIVCGIALIGAR